MSDTSAGPVVGTAPATLGQLGQWFEQQIFPAQYRPLWNLPEVWRLDPGSDRDTVVAAVVALVRRHEALRTTFVTDAAGTLTQRVHEVRQPPILDVTVTAEEAAGPRPPLPDRFKYTPFDLANEWPSRFALVLDESGTVCWVACIVNHTAGDAHATRILERDFRALLAGGAARPAAQPRDLAREERSPAGLARTARAAGYFARQVGELPAGPAAAGDGSPLLWRERRMAYVELRSPALYHAVKELRRTTRLALPALILAPYVGLLARHTGQELIGVNVVAANRADRLTRETVACLAQPVLVTFDTAGAGSVLELGRRCHSALLRGYRHSRYDVLEVERLLVAERERRGAAPAIDRVFDFWDGHPDVVPDRPPTADQLDTGRSTVDAGNSGDREMRAPEQSLRVRVSRSDVSIWLWSDAAFLSEDGIRALLLGVETALVDAAAGRERSVPELGATRV